MPQHLLDVGYVTCPLLNWSSTAMSWNKENIIYSLCQRLGLTLSVRNKPQARSASIERRRHENLLQEVLRCQRLGLTRSVRNKPQARLESAARGFAKQNRVFEHTHLPLYRPGVSIQKLLPKNELNTASFYWSKHKPIDNNGWSILSFGW